MFYRSKMDMLAVEYWCGWEVKWRDGQPSYLWLALLLNSHGPVFTRKLYFAWKFQVSKYAGGGVKIFNRMIKYLSKSPHVWPPSIMSNSDLTERFFFEVYENLFSGMR